MVLILVVSVEGAISKLYDTQLMEHFGRLDPSPWINLGEFPNHKRPKPPIWH